MICFQSVLYANLTLIIQTVMSVYKTCVPCPVLRSVSIQYSLEVLCLGLPGCFPPVKPTET